ncbi:MAG: FAD-binding oxidoreductase [Nitriliruptor sp.]|nr:MAG: FAD-binding oxidoreductase [Nitriliruptor sp.]
MRESPPPTADAVVIGGGIVGACCADALSAAGLRVAIVERHGLAGGTTAAGEGNILVSDKELGPELELALLSNRLWTELGEELRAAAVAPTAGPADAAAADIELEAKGGLMVAMTDAGHDAITTLAVQQRAAGVVAEPIDAAAAAELEPHLTPGLVGAMHYPQDQQVQPVKASAAMLRRARGRGASLHPHTPVTGITRGRDGRVTGVVTRRGAISTGVVVNAAGVWSRQLAAMAGADLPIAPRRGQILVTEPLPLLVHRKVYDADYVGTVGAADPTAAAISSVIEGTRAGTILIGSSRELVGLDRRSNLPLLARMAARAMELFPVLADVHLLRTYLGFRPYSPDHLPIIGEDGEVAGLFHATGHEGAGIGLAPATGALLASLVTATTPPLDPARFAADRASLHPAAADEEPVDA